MAMALTSGGQHEDREEDRRAGEKGPFSWVGNGKEKQNPEIHKKEEKTLESKKFACPELNFERPANLGSYEVRRVKTGLNFEISRIKWDVSLLSTCIQI
jgi:hypothetical protein